MMAGDFLTLVAGGLLTIIACTFSSTALASGRRPQPHFQAVSQVIQRSFFKHEIGIPLSPLPGSGPGACMKGQRTAFLQALAELRDRPQAKPEDAVRMLFSRAKCVPWLISGQFAEPGMMRVEVLHVRELPSTRIVEAVKAYWWRAPTELQMPTEVSAVISELFPVEAPRNFIADPLRIWSDLNVNQIDFSVTTSKVLENSVSLLITFKYGK